MRLSYRSNAAAAIAGQQVAIFGGWAVSGLAPLADLAIFCLQSGCWVNLSSTRSSKGGNPSSCGASDSSENGQAFSRAANGNAPQQTDKSSFENTAAVETDGHASEPCPRGQPSLTSTTDGAAMLLFGGWGTQLPSWPQHAFASCDLDACSKIVCCGMLAQGTAAGSPLPAAGTASGGSTTCGTCRQSPGSGGSCSQQVCCGFCI